jgi:formylglycine-generating enzyme required for sulfatase activity
MACFSRSWLRRITGWMIPLLFLFGCASPTPAPPPPPPHAALTAVEVPGRVVRADNSEDLLERNRSFDVQVNDRVQFDEAGRGLLLFPGRLEAGMYRKTELQLTGANQEVSGAITVDLFLTYGNTHLRLLGDGDVQAVLKTDYATLTTLDAGTEFVVCHTPERITCGVVNEGAVAFRAEGEEVIAKKGEAIYVRPGEPPSIAICARPEEVQDWLDRIQGTGEVTPLGAIVSGWPQESCERIAQMALTPDIPSLPSSEGMVKIEAGLYEIGRAEADEFHSAPQDIQLDGYWIDVFEVTNAGYQAFLDATGAQPPAVWPGRADHPVQGVTWEQANAYCSFANKRLPSEAEWEAAARGPGPQPPLYPWGDDRTAGGQADRLPLTDTYPVGSNDFNRSPLGVYDMAGNVWEWMAEPYPPFSEGDLILRGGRHGLIRDSAYRQVAVPNLELFIPYAGFRCAADRVEGE